MAGSVKALDYGAESRGFQSQLILPSGDINLKMMVPIREDRNHLALEYHRRRVKDAT